MTSKIKVNLSDKYRTLLTDVLPYELPLWFTNDNFYKASSTQRKNIYITASALKENKAKLLIPLDYRISRGDGLPPRQISIMHPLAQWKVCDFYSDFDELIKYYCSKSKHSLRHPYRKARQFYNKSDFDSQQNTKIDIDGYESAVASSYFKYKEFAFLYSFFESYSYHQLEKKFKFMLEVDISKCFPSIYTHSIGWATKSKSFVKKNLGSNRGSFDAEFDNLMQTMNYKETNGIIVGPEVSRIFCEIILQRIDINTVEKIKKYGLMLGRHYNFKRYVDDYFLFYNRPETKSVFLRCLQECLLDYKLHLNESKTKSHRRPFTTDISLAKHSLKLEIQSFYSRRYKESNLKHQDESAESGLKNIKPCTNPAREANIAIRNTKYCFTDYNVPYQPITNYLLSSIEKNTSKYLAALTGSDNTDIGYLNWILVDLDLLFFIHSMDIRVRPTDRLARTVVNLIEKAPLISSRHSSLIYQKIFDQVRQSIDIVIMDSDNINGIETLNLLVILSQLPNDYLLPLEALTRYALAASQAYRDNEIDYFSWVTFMLYVRDHPRYANLRRDLAERAKRFFENHPDNFISTEFFLFYFDFLSCPYISDDQKHELTKLVNTKTLSKPPSPDMNNTLFKEYFIVSWSDPDYLKNSLEKKRFTFPYE